MNIKTIIISAIFIAVSATFANADENRTAIYGAKSILITETPDGMKAVVKTDSDSMLFEQTYQPGATVVSRLNSSGFSLTGSKRKYQSTGWNLITSGLGFGFCSAPGAPGAVGIEMGKSFELSWLNILAAQSTNRFGNSFSIGVGINWRNYRTTLDHRFTVTDGIVGTGDYPEGVTPRLSRIKIFTVQFPVLYTQRLPIRLVRDNMALKFGPVFDLNTHASVLTSWRDGKRTSTNKVNGINVRPFTIDLFASVHLAKCFGLYVRYSPYNAFTGNHPLNFHQFSTGIMLMM